MGEGVADTSGVVLRMIPKNSRDVVGLLKPTDLESLNVMPSCLAIDFIIVWVVWMALKVGAMTRISSM